MENKKRVPFMLYDAFSKSAYGKKLASEVRYSRYKPDSVSNSYWVELLGPDVNNLTHLIVSFEMTERFIAHCNYPIVNQGSLNFLAKFDQEESHLLYLTAVIHDFGEAIVGDKMWDRKTQQDEYEELLHLQQILSELSLNNAGLINEFELMKTLHVLRDTKSKLGQAFNTVEAIGYVATAVRAWTASKFSISDSQLHVNLKWLASNVLANHVPRLMGLRDLYPAVETFLSHESFRIDEAFEEMPCDVFHRYDKVDDVDSNTARFNFARNSWFSGSLLAR